MRTSFILCEASDTHQITHVICTSHPAIFDYPGFNLVSGSNSPKVRESAITWFESRAKPEIMKVRSQPSGFQEAMVTVKQQRETINIAVPAKAVGISEKYMLHCVDDIKWMGAISRIPMAYRRRSIDAVSELYLK